MMHIGFTEKKHGLGAGKQTGLHSVNPLRLLLFGRPIPTDQQEATLLRKRVALAVFSSDAISSVAYATQEILYVLTMAGLWTVTTRPVFNQVTAGVTLGIVALLAVVATSYWQTIFAYPSGGGSYIVGKENIGTHAGLVAAAALLIDYVLTVAVSIASGVQNILDTPIGRSFHQEHVLVCLLFIALVAFLNLRGLRESGKLFAVPTYSFVIMATVMIALGLIGPHFGWTLHAPEPEAALPAGLPIHTGMVTSLLLMMLVPKAFASGCSAMTGTEAVSNGVPAFREPKSRNAALTLAAMAGILGFLFLGISGLAIKLNVVYAHMPGYTSPAVIDQLSAQVFGKTGPIWRTVLYYAMQVTTMLILVVAANTSFADFPRLSAILARDRFFPRQLANVGDRMVYSNGIVMLAGFAMLLIVVFHGSVDRLIPLYALGVFTAFTISQSGMVIHWYRERGTRWKLKLAINGLGATTTFIVLCVIVAVKGREGAWIVVVVAAILLALFRAIEGHYNYVRSKLSPEGMEPFRAESTNTVLVLTADLHRGVFPALAYARSISPDCRAIHIEINPDDVARLRQKWERYVGEDIPLVILPSPYRSVIGPLLAYLEEVQRERANHTVTVVVPEFVPGKWWHALLHNSNAFLVKLYLSHRPGVIVTNVRYFLDDAPASSQEAAKQSDNTVETQQ